MSCFKKSRADWIRTSDPYVPNVVRYRAALLPDFSPDDFYSCEKSNQKKSAIVKTPADIVGWIPI